MEQTIQIFIYVHTFLGGLGLVSGALSISVKKGSKIHRRSGKIFSITMISSAALSLFIAAMPGHKNLFLFLIGVFTIYLVLAGNRALHIRGRFRGNAKSVDKIISGTMLLGSVAMLFIGFYGMFTGIANSMLFVFFGVFGIILTLKDFQNFKKTRRKKTNWLKIHIGRMVGAMIASVTAFIVAGLNFDNLFAWMFPTIIGTVYIIFWSRKVENSKAVG
ncbi:hypothetical protein J8281_13090 [Aquimarina sp. U1-2]|uniref:hypothetical protein n=1 Tax=Aquimarina sp. U1-2 TaxID=2823141 RepID=UPI001AECA3A0|nr:hypothetical protein [Aquimarina sp. U1-2]MBP2833123.1 hypothetical protein [Aquimarina sp. U1-2]